MFGDLPPNSRVILFKLLTWDSAMTLYPTSVDPVKAILSTLGCLARAAPASPNPVRT